MSPNLTWSTGPGQAVWVKLVEEVICGLWSERRMQKTVTITWSSPKWAITGERKWNQFSLEKPKFDADCNLLQMRDFSWTITIRCRAENGRVGQLDASLQWRGRVSLKEHERAKASCWEAVGQVKAKLEAVLVSKMQPLWLKLPYLSGSLVRLFSRARLLRVAAWH